MIYLPIHPSIFQSLSSLEDMTSNFSLMLSAYDIRRHNETRVGVIADSPEATNNTFAIMGSLLRPCKNSVAALADPT
jgi:hypothetical protein